MTWRTGPTTPANRQPSGFPCRCGAPIWSLGRYCNSVLVATFLCGQRKMNHQRHHGAKGPCNDGLGQTRPGPSGGGVPPPCSSRSAQAGASGAIRRKRTNRIGRTEPERRGSARSPTGRRLGFRVDPAALAPLPRARPSSAVGRAVRRHRRWVPACAPLHPAASADCPGPAAAEPRRPISGDPRSDPFTYPWRKSSKRFERHIENRSYGPWDTCLTCRC